MTNRPIQAGEVGRELLFSQLNVDWADLGHTIKLHVTLKDSGVTNTYNMSAVASFPLQGKILTTAEMFPDAGTYRVQVVSYDGTDPALRSEMGTIVVADND